MKVFVRSLNGVYINRQICSSGMPMLECSLHSGVAGLFWIQHNVWDAVQHEHGEAQND